MPRCAASPTASPPAPSCAAASGWPPRRTGLPRSRRWRCSSAGATPSTPPPRRASCSRWSSRTRADRAARRRWSSSRRPTVRCTSSTGKVRRPPRRARGPSRSSGSSSSPGPACSPPACPARSARGCSCSSASARCRFARCSSRRSATPGGVSRCSPRSRSCSPRSPGPRHRAGRPRPSSGSAAACRWRGHRSATKRSPTPSSAFSSSPSAPAATASASSGRRGRTVYEGFVAEAIDAFARQPVADEIGEHTGLITAADLAGWQPSLEPPARLAYRDLEVCKTGPWAQGPVLLQQLGLLAGIEVASLGLGSAELVHVLTECTKLALADREAWYGDPRMVDVPLVDLLSPAYCDERRRLVGDRASLELRPGRPGGREPRLPALLAGLVAGGSESAAGGPGPGTSELLHLPPDLRGRADGGAGPADGAARPADRVSGAADGVAAAGDAAGDAAGAGRNRGDTCHVDVADRFGNMISATPSGGWLQGSPTIPGLGFCLGTRAQMFWLEQGLPSSIAPGKRPRTTLSPALALRDGRPALAFGTPGGDQQDQWTLSFLVYHLDFGLGLQAAIDAANWHTNHARLVVLPPTWPPWRARRRGVARGRGARRAARPGAPCRRVAGVLARTRHRGRRRRQGDARRRRRSPQRPGLRRRPLSFCRARHRRDAAACGRISHDARTRLVGNDPQRT